jgi:hypothetical protein
MAISDAELYCVKTKICVTFELMQLEPERQSADISGERHGGFRAFRVKGKARTCSAAQDYRDNITY